MRRAESTAVFLGFARVFREVFILPYVNIPTLAEVEEFIWYLPKELQADGFFPARYLVHR